MNQDPPSAEIARRANIVNDVAVLANSEKEYIQDGMNKQVSAYEIASLSAAAAEVEESGWRSGPHPDSGGAGAVQN